MLASMPTNQRPDGPAAFGAGKGSGVGAAKGSGVGAASGAAFGGLDETNVRLLSELQADARLSLAELGRRVGLSSPAVADRVGRLEEAGVIRGYRADLDPRALGYALSVVIRIRPAPRELRKVADVARETPEIVQCDRVTGEDCYVMRAHVRDVEHLEEVIDRFAIYGQTTSSIVQSSPVPGRGVPL
jgi:Lrp/AsnC family leucine-responsive transcriptional regulator